MTSKEKIFLKHVKEKCKEHNVKLVLKNTIKIKLSDNIYVGGYFWEGNKENELACAMNSPEYMDLFVHEYSHMEQWIEKTPLWKNIDANAIEEWMEGKEINVIKNNHLKHLHDDVMGIHKKLDENIVRIYDKLDRFLYTLLGFMATLLISLLIHFFFK